MSDKQQELEEQLAKLLLESDDSDGETIKGEPSDEEPKENKFVLIDGRPPKRKPRPFWEEPKKELWFNFEMMELDEESGSYISFYVEYYGDVEVKDYARRCTNAFGLCPTKAEELEKKFTAAVLKAVRDRFFGYPIVSPVFQVILDHNCEEVGTSEETVSK